MLNFNMIKYFPSLISVGYPSNLDNNIEYKNSEIFPNKITSPKFHFI